MMPCQTSTAPTADPAAPKESGLPLRARVDSNLDFAVSKDANLPGKGRAAYVEHVAEGGAPFYCANGLNGHSR